MSQLVPFMKSNKVVVIIVQIVLRKCELYFSNEYLLWDTV